MAFIAVLSTLPYQAMSTRDCILCAICKCDCYRIAAWITITDMSPYFALCVRAFSCAFATMSFCCKWVTAPAARCLFLVSFGARAHALYLPTKIDVMGCGDRPLLAALLRLVRSVIITPVTSDRRNRPSQWCYLFRHSSFHVLWRREMETACLACSIC